MEKLSLLTSNRNKMRISSITIAIMMLFFVACSQNEGKKKNAEMTFKAETTFDFGKIAYNGDGKHEFVFKNTGKSPLIITNVKSSCGCTVPIYPKDPVKKGETEKISVVYDTKRVGVFSKTITVYSNSKNSPVKLRIKGEVLRSEQDN